MNAPAGLIYPGDAGFPPGQTGLNKQWWNLSPRLGAAWDVTGDGRMALRASYALAYDFMAGEYHNINSSAPPFGNRSLITDPPGRMDDPYGHVGGDPHPIETNRNAPYVRSAPSARWIPRSTLHACRTGTSRSSGSSAPTGASR